MKKIIYEDDKWIIEEFPEYNITDDLIIVPQLCRSKYLEVTILPSTHNTPYSPMEPSVPQGMPRIPL